MKLLSITLVSSLALFSTVSEASNNTYVYSNAEYCQLANGTASAPFLDAYSRKLGFTPTTEECRALTKVVNEQSAVSAQQDVRKLLREALKGSALRPSASLVLKMTEMSAAERQQTLTKLFS
ncbi:hypothetical protein [Rheinheimera pleomorphica]|uniref:hypothetical protein n=1 Tax=Rheinheimera pleomorphica TaxID=2703963 RepID=UPI001420A76A|nr:hypothetical protein [Rheinheimera pleomorphica]